MDPITYPTNPLTGGPPASPLTQRTAYARWAFYTGLAGGVLILLCGFVVALFMMALVTFGGVLPTTWYGVATPRGAWPNLPVLIGMWGLLTGGAVILSAIGARDHPDRAAVPGVVMLAAGVLSFFALGGFFLGGLLSIVAGVLAIAGSRSIWHAREPRYRDREYRPPPVGP